MTQTMKLRMFRSITIFDSSRTKRTETDSLGSMELPLHAYYGIQSQRARENFPLAGHIVHNQLIHAIGLVKLACIEANVMTGCLPQEIGEAIKLACKEFLEGQYDDQIIVESIQGGAGTSINMNVNEVLANRAIEILGYEKGRYDIVSPNTHVNMAQSTNDVIPTAFKVAVLLMKDKLV
ncbi:MAG: lyase family protein, partial [Bacillota bacterium]|nr:lyase family protein [Bacillota bacterium]